MKYDIIFFSGQSNMQGQTERLSECEVVKDAFEYRLFGGYKPLCNPVGENVGKNSEEVTPDYTDIPGMLAKCDLLASWEGHTNMVPAFCRAYTRASGRGVLAVHVAKGSTCASDWLPGKPCFEAAKAKGLAAIDAAGKFDVGNRYLVWYQGESDAVAGTDKSTYKSVLRGVKDGFGSALGIDAFCVIKVGRFTLDARDEEIMSAQVELCREEEGFSMLTEINDELLSDEKYLNPYAAGHLGALGQEKLGSVAGEALAAVCRR